MFLNIKASWLRMTGQAIALLSLICLLWFLIGEGIPDLSKGEGKELLFFVPFFVFTVLGYVLAYFYPLPGAIMMVTAGVLMMCYNLLFESYSTALIFGFPFITAGALTLIAIRMSAAGRVSQKVTAMS